MHPLRSLLRTDPAAALREAQRADRAQALPPGEAAFVAGAALLALGRDEDARAALRAALAADPAHRPAAMTLAHALRHAGRYRAATDVVAASVAASRHDPEFALRAIGFLADFLQYEAAERAWTTTQGQPDADALYLGGEIAMALGDADAARERLDRCLHAAPAHPGALLLRAQVGGGRSDAAFGALLERLDTARARLPVDAAIALDFARGRWALDAGDPALAFACFDRGNAARHAQVASRRHPDPPDRPVRAADMHPAPDAAASSGSDVVLVVGMPRSGTTLLASRLGQHAQVADRGELAWLGGVARGLATPADYIAHLRQDDAPRARYIDKNPLNARHLPTVATAFPEARVLHVRRDPRDVAVSVYTQCFQHPDMDWAFAWDEILAFQRDHRARIAQRPRDLAWLDIDYADLVGDPEATLRRAVAFLDLPWDAAVLETASHGSIATASTVQARQPISGDAVGRWRATAAFTPELIAAYGGADTSHATN